MLGVYTSHLYKFYMIYSLFVFTPQCVSDIIGEYYNVYLLLCIYFQSMSMMNSNNGTMILNMNWNLWYHIRYKYGIIFCLIFTFYCSLLLFKYSPMCLYANDPLNYIASFSVTQFMYVINAISNILNIVTNVYYRNWWM